MAKMGGGQERLVTRNVMRDERVVSRSVDVEQGDRTAGGHIVIKLILTCESLRGVGTGRVPGRGPVAAAPEKLN